jgi:GTP-binding protein
VGAPCSASRPPRGLDWRDSVLLVSPPLELRFVTSADRLDSLPESPAEVAVVGRSNVGKSSLLNAVANRNGLAKTSNTPGRTQRLNCFALPDGRTVVDCPGYGYAKASKSQRASMSATIERYLLGRHELKMVLLLVDGEVGPTALDRSMLEWLREAGLPHQLIATKHDKVKAAKRDKRKRELAAACGLEPGDVVWVSAARNVGIDRLRDLVRLWLSP